MGFHILLLLSGGMVESSLPAKSPVVVNDYVSQADIAPFLAKLNSVELRSMGYPLLCGKRPVPVINIAEEGVFLPETSQLIPSTDVGSTLNLENLPDELVYLHNYLEFSFKPTGFVPSAPN